MPCRWADGGLRDFSGRVRFRRRFGYPGRIDVHERVWLTFDEIEGMTEIQLNGTLLSQRDAESSARLAGAIEVGAASRAAPELPATDTSRPARLAVPTPPPVGAASRAASSEFEITALLQERNELVVEVEGTADRGGLCGEVALEVRCAAYLREVRIWATTGDLHVAGEVVGTADGLLELYVVLDRANVAYSRAEVSPKGRPFHLVAEGVSAERTQQTLVKVDLVKGATVWYTLERTISASPPMRETAG
jgi:hypothetical protein